MRCCFLPCFCVPKRQKQKHPQTSANANSTVRVDGGEQVKICLFHSHRFAEGGAVVETATAAAIDQFQATQQKTVIEESIDWIVAQSKDAVTSNEELIKKKKSIDATEVKEEDEQPAAVTEEKKENVVNEQEEEYCCSESLFSVSLGSGKPFTVSAAENAEVNSSPMQEEEEEEQPSSAKVEEKIKLLELDQPNPNPNQQQLIIKNKDEKGKAATRYPDNCLLNDDAAHQQEMEEDSSESSLFSLPNDYTKPISPTDEKEVSSSSTSLFLIMPPAAAPPPPPQQSEGNNTNIPSLMLNSIENLTQGGKVGKPTTVLLKPLKKNHNKENIINLTMQDGDDVEYTPPIMVSPEPNLKLSDSKSEVVVRQKISEKREVINTSLSSWLVESETTPKSITNNNEDRPILGALTIEDINKYSAMSTKSSTFNSTRCRRRSCSPDDTPIIGTVGSYWSYTGQSNSSKFNTSGKDVKTRLEAAFEASVAEN